MTSGTAAAPPEGGSREQTRAQAMRTMEERRAAAKRMTGERMTGAFSMEKSRQASPRTAGPGRAAAAPARWRISANDELQRAVEGGEWQTVLSPANVRFHAVAVMGENVWAGGSQASLFHSGDDGASWEQVKLPRRDLSAPTITRIEFEDALHGAVVADDGTAWLTSDGGRSWVER
jgi:photosystem II stability/assembly factor-like uncharacterized protein